MGRQPGRSPRCLAAQGHPAPTGALGRGPPRRGTRAVRPAAGGDGWRARRSGPRDRLDPPREHRRQPAASQPDRASACDPAALRAEARTARGSLPRRGRKAPAELLRAPRHRRNRGAGAGGRARPRSGAGRGRPDLSRGNPLHAAAARQGDCPHRRARPTTRGPGRAPAPPAAGAAGRRRSAAQGRPGGGCPRRCAPRVRRPATGVRHLARRPGRAHGASPDHAGAALRGTRGGLGTHGLDLRPLAGRRRLGRATAHADDLAGTAT